VTSPQRARPGESPAGPLPGTKAKQAKALAHNLEFMCREFGVETVGFLTLTVGDRDASGRWVGVRDRAEASRRFNSILNRIRERYRCGVVVTERHKSGAIHFHLLVATGHDIRTGLDFDAVKRRDYRSASEALRAEWAWWREIERKKRYGFGRHELLPVKTTAVQVSRYVAKYLSKSWQERTADDKGGRCLRYFGRWSKQGLKVGPPMSARHGSITPRASAWRQCLKQIALRCTLGGKELNEQNIKDQVGPRWAWRITRKLNFFEFFIPGRGSEAIRQGIEEHNAEATAGAESCGGKVRHIADSDIEHWLPTVGWEFRDLIEKFHLRLHAWEDEFKRDCEHAWRAAVIYFECGAATSSEGTAP